MAGERGVGMEWNGWRVVGVEKADWDLEDKDGF